jgi:hypothetical protein
MFWTCRHGNQVSNGRSSASGTSFEGSGQIATKVAEDAVYAVYSVMINMARAVASPPKFRGGRGQNRKKLGL